MAEISGLVKELGREPLSECPWISEILTECRCQPATMLQLFISGSLQVGSGKCHLLWQTAGETVSIE